MLTFNAAFAHDRVDGAFDKASGDTLAIEAALRVVRDHALVVGDICRKLDGSFAQGHDTGVVGLNLVQIDDQTLDRQLTVVQVAVP